MDKQEAKMRQVRLAATPRACLEKPECRVSPPPPSSFFVCLTFPGRDSAGAREGLQDGRGDEGRAGRAKIL